MDSDIEFGEIEEASPQTHLRPDRNKHFAVVPYGKPVAGELPIYVDLDVLRDMEAHAQSDTSVELGGVLLGGQHADEAGNAFVVITDSLRAAHYESTKGSFKFTHDTWSAISRERDQFPAELQMAGWYHTHPDWGVFLSGMDMFICDHFFNKRLDVAYVIDPCRGDRAMFQWTGDPRERVRRTGGFYVIASRFRQDELAAYVLQLEGKATMPQQFSPAGYPQPIIQMPAPSPPPEWHLPAVMSMLLVQACFLALIAWKLIDTSRPTETGSADQLAAKLDELIRSERLNERIKTQNQVLDSVLTNLKGTEPGFAERLEQQLDKSKDLALDVDTYRAQLAAQKQSTELTQAKLTALERDLASTKDSLNSRIEALREQRDLLSKEKAEARAQLAAAEAKLHPKFATDDASGDSAAGNRYVWWIGGGSVALLALIAAVAIGLRRPPLKNEEAAAVSEMDPKQTELRPNT